MPSLMRSTNNERAKGIRSSKPYRKKAQAIAPHETPLPDYDYDQMMAYVRRHGVVYAPLAGQPLSPQYFDLRPRLSALRAGKNVLAIEGHNATVGSKAFTVDPCLIGVLNADPGAPAAGGK